MTDRTTSPAQAIAAIVGKDLRQRTRDRSAYLFAFVAPLVLATIFSIILPSTDGSDLVIGTAVSGDPDVGFGALIEALEGDGLLEVTRTADLDGTRAAVDRGDVGVGLHVVAAPDGRRVDVTVVTDPDAPISAAVGTAIAEGFLARSSTVALVATVVAQDAAAADPAAVQQRVDAAIEAAVASDVATLRLTGTETSDRRLDETTYLAAGMAVFFLFFTVQFGVTSLLTERHDGTLPRLLTSPTPRWAVIAAKVVVSLLLGLVSMAVLLLAGQVLLGAVWGDPAGVSLLVLAAVLAAVSIVGVVAVLARTAEQASNWQAIIAIVLGMLGGAFFPVATGPGLLADLSLLSPHAWFLRGLADLAPNTAGLADVLPSVLALVVFSAVGGVVALLLSGRRSLL